MYEVIFVRNGPQTYVKNLRVLSQRKIRETWFYEIFYSHSRTAGGSVVVTKLRTELADLVGGPGWELVWEELPVHGVHAHKVLDVGQEDCGAHHAREAASSLLNSQFIKNKLN
jgi:hypothetical protein